MTDYPFQCGGVRISRMNHETSTIRPANGGMDVTAIRGSANKRVAGSADLIAKGEIAMGGKDNAE